MTQLYEALHQFRPDIVEVFAAELDRLRRPGTWWTGLERVAIAREARAVLRLLLGRSVPNEQRGSLREDLAGAIGTIVGDPGRLSPSWLSQLLACGLSVGQYVEMVGVIAATVTVDTFYHALGMDLPDLGDPVDGEPIRRAPAGAVAHQSWVPSVPPEAAEGALKQVYERMSQRTGRVANVVRAMSYVPAEQVGFMSLAFAMYMKEMTIGRPLVELVATTVSALNDCFY
jgi:hypothetical protein